MLKIITDNEKTKVVYDDEKKVYIKTFYKNKRLRMRLRLYLGLKEYPGINFKKTNDMLLKINGGVNCSEIVSYNKYSVTTKEIEGKSLHETLKECDKERLKIFIEKYINIVSEILKEIIKRKIYYNDFNFHNFIVDKNENLYVIDLEGYTKDFFFFIHKKDLLKGVKETIVSECRKEDLIEKNIDAEKIYEEIEKRLKNIQI